MKSTEYQIGDLVNFVNSKGDIVNAGQYIPHDYECNETLFPLTRHGSGIVKTGEGVVDLVTETHVVVSFMSKTAGTTTLYFRPHVIRLAKRSEPIINNNYEIF